MKIAIRKILPILLLLSLFISFSGCSTVPYTNRSQFILMDVDEEMSLSAAAYREFLSEVNIETGTNRARLISQIGWRIAGVADRPDYEWEFLVVKDDNTVNASCLPGGKVFVYTGIINLAENNEAELAAIMGHEIAHALARHGAESVNLNQLAALGVMGTAVAASIFLEEDYYIEGAVLGVALLASLGITLPHSRLQESEADHIGLILMAKAGYNPHYAVSFWQRMARYKGSESMAFLSTHPLTADRVKDISALLPKVMPYYNAAPQKFR